MHARDLFSPDQDPKTTRHRHQPSNTKGICRFELFELFVDPVMWGSFDVSKLRQKLWHMQGVPKQF